MTGTIYREHPEIKREIYNGSLMHNFVVNCKVFIFYDFASSIEGKIFDMSSQSLDDILNLQTMEASSIIEEDVSTEIDTLSWRKAQVIET